MGENARVRRRALTAIAVALVAGATLPAAAPAWEQGKVANPSVEGPIEGGLKGYPRNMSLFDLDDYGYSEREYFFGGTATDLSNGLSAPYKSRMLVRLPRDAEKFNGHVVVEWLNVTGATDLETDWAPAGEYLMREGYGYVAVSAQMVGVCCGPASLKGWDQQRYGSLLHPGDDFSFDIFSQSIEALRDPAHNGTTILSPRQIDPMSGLRVRYIEANGASQSASRLTDYVNGGYNRTGVDLFQITRGGGPYDDFSTPIFELNEENNEIPQPDGPNFVGWEEAGAAHAPAGWWDYVWAMQQRDDVGPATPDAVNVGCSVNRADAQYSFRAMTHWSRLWLEQGLKPPTIERVQRDAAGEIARDDLGLAKGGIRHPFVEVPVAMNRSDSSDCPLWGIHQSWSAEQVKSLYPTHNHYLAKVQAWADHELELGWLLPEDREDAIARAEAFDGPWEHGDCYDTAQEDADTAGPLSGPLGEASFDPSLPLGTHAAAREAACRAAAAGL
jgi:hypothetical protein